MARFMSDTSTFRKAMRPINPFDFARVTIDKSKSRIEAVDRYLRMATLTTVNHSTFDRYDISAEDIGKQYCIDAGCLKALIDAASKIDQHEYIEMIIDFNDDALNVINGRMNASISYVMPRAAKEYPNIPMDTITVEIRTTGGELSEVLKLAKRAECKSIALISHDNTTSICPVVDNKEIGNPMYHIPSEMQQPSDHVTSMYAVECLKHIADTAGKNTPVCIKYGQYYTTKINVHTEKIQSEYVIAPIVFGY